MAAQTKTKSNKISDVKSNDSVDIKNKLAVARRNMVLGQLMPANINDANILSAMDEVAREEFVPEIFYSTAYLDEDVKLEKDRFLMNPVALGRLIMAAEIKKTDNILEIGSATGYSTAILARLANRVMAVETNQNLYSQAKNNLSVYKNITLLNDLNGNDLIKKSPFDVVFIMGSVDFIPDSVFDLLKSGGRLITSMRSNNVSTARMYSRLEGDNHAEYILFDNHIKPLPEFIKKPEFKL